MLCRALISALTFLQQLTMCLAFNRALVLLQGHADSTLFFVINSFLFPPPHKEVFLDLSDNLHGFGGAVQDPPRPLEKGHFDCAMVGDYLFEKER